MQKDSEKSRQDLAKRMSWEQCYTVKEFKESRKLTSDESIRQYLRGTIDKRTGKPYPPPADLASFQFLSPGENPTGNQWLIYKPAPEPEEPPDESDLDMAFDADHSWYRELGRLIARAENRLDDKQFRESAWALCEIWQDLAMNYKSVLDKAPIQRFRYSKLWNDAVRWAGNPLINEEGFDGPSDETKEVKKPAVLQQPIEFVDKLFEAYLFAVLNRRNVKIEIEFQPSGKTLFRLEKPDEPFLQDHFNYSGVYKNTILCWAKEIAEGKAVAAGAGTIPASKHCLHCLKALGKSTSNPYCESNEESRHRTWVYNVKKLKRSEQMDRIMKRLRDCHKPLS